MKKGWPLLGLSLLGLTALSFLGDLWWRFELLSHFRVPLLMLAGVGVLIEAGRRRAWGATLAGLAAAAHGGALFLALSPLPAQAQERPSLRLLVANVLTSNADPEALLDFIQAQNPDVIALMEVDADWMRRLAALDEGWPQRVSEPRQDNFGVVLYSRLPAREMEVLWLSSDGGGVPALRAEVETPDGPVWVLLAHPLPPVSARYVNDRNAQLIELSEIVQQTAGPVVLAGDLNITPYAPRFQRLLRDAGLRDARRLRGGPPTRGPRGTWPAGMPGWLRIPIDHVLVSEGVGVVSFETGPIVGSDHLPLMAELALP